MKATTRLMLSRFAGGGQRITARGVSEHGVSYQHYIDVSYGSEPTADVVKKIREFADNLERALQTDVSKPAEPHK